MRSGGWGPHNAISALVRQTPERRSLVLSAMWGWQEGGRLQTRKSQDSETVLCLGAASPRLPGQRRGVLGPWTPGPRSAKLVGRKGPGGPYKAPDGHVALLCLGPGMDMLQSRKFWAPLSQLATESGSPAGVSENPCAPHRTRSPA